MSIEPGDCPNFRRDLSGHRHGAIAGENGTVPFDDADLESDEMVVSMGPQHPSTHGVLRVVLRTDGEVVVEATPHVGYLHRSSEKIGENLMPRRN